MGARTIISNIYSNPAVSIPSGTVEGLPVGMQVLARHHEDGLLFDVALAAERNNPWPFVASKSYYRLRQHANSSYSDGADHFAIARHPDIKHNLPIGS